MGRKAECGGVEGFFLPHSLGEQLFQTQRWLSEIKIRCNIYKIGIVVIMFSS